MSDAPVAPSAAPTSIPSSAPVSEASESEGLNPEESEVEELAAKIEEAKSNKKKYQLKVNNKMKDFELDLSDDAEVQKYLQKAMASDEKFQEAATLRQQVEQLVSELKRNPLAILKHPNLGIDIKALAQQVFNEEIEEMKLSPEQKRIKELEDSLSAREKRDKEMEDERSANERSKMEHQAAEELDNQITAALSKSNLPKSPYVLRRMADTMISAMDMGYGDVTPEQILPFVEEQILGEINKLFESAPEATFDKVMENIVGKKHLDKYRKAKVAKSRAKPAPVSANQIKDSGKSVSASKEEAKKETPMRFKDMFKSF
jgi:hypothetical protein